MARFDPQMRAYDLRPQMRCPHDAVDIAGRVDVPPAWRECHGVRFGVRNGHFVDGRQVRRRVGFRRIVDGEDQRSARPQRVGRERQHFVECTRSARRSLVDTGSLGDFATAAVPGPACAPGTSLPAAEVPRGRETSR